MGLPGELFKGLEAGEAERVVKLPRCALEGCDKEVWVEPDGLCYLYCCRTHGQQANVVARDNSGLRIDTELPECATNSVIRCHGFIVHQLTSQAKPCYVLFKGSAICPLCHDSFHHGQQMVKCYVNPDPACRWIHLNCAMDILGPLP